MYVFRLSQLHFARSPKWKFGAHNGDARGMMMQWSSVLARRTRAENRGDIVSALSWNSESYFHYSSRVQVPVVAK